jgi:transcriptional regulator with GAF, ATPase, and Fis domain
MNQIFVDQDSVLQQQVQALLGTEGAAQYQDYSKNLLSTLTAQQFKEMMTGTDAAKEDKSKQLSQLMQEEVQTVLAGAGLPADYQTIPMLNFRNIASEQQGEQSLKLLDDIYQRVATRGSSFLSADELAKFQEFKTTAINNNRAALTLNRTLMAPISN